MYVKEMMEATHAELIVVNVNGVDVVPEPYKSEGISPRVHRVVNFEIMDQDLWRNKLAISISGGTGELTQGYTKRGARK